MIPNLNMQDTYGLLLSLVDGRWSLRSVLLVLVRIISALLVCRSPVFGLTFLVVFLGNVRLIVFTTMAEMFHV